MAQPQQEPPLLLVGTDFRCAPIELRERVSCTGEEAEHALVHLLARPGVSEAFLLSTCNRTEVYLQPQDEDEAYRTVLELIFLKKSPELERPGRLYVKRNGEAARHLLAVASGLESMVLGEPEILGQVKQSAALAEHVGASGPVMRRLLRSALSAGARARQETDELQGQARAGNTAPADR
jgi:glutamyl-tRNA reductase